MAITFLKALFNGPASILLNGYIFILDQHLCNTIIDIIEPVHEISNNVVCATSKASDQPAHTRSLIIAFACRLNIL